MFTPVDRAAAMTSCPASRSRAARRRPIRPVPPMMVIFMDLHSATDFAAESTPPARSAAGPRHDNRPALSRNRVVARLPPHLGRLEARAGLERAMDGATVGDREQFGMLRLVEIALDLDPAAEDVGPFLILFLPVRHAGADAVDGPALAIGKEAQRHRRAGGEPGGEQIIGSRARSEPAGAFGLVGDEGGLARAHRELELAEPRFLGTGVETAFGGRW